MSTMIWNGEGLAACTMAWQMAVIFLIRQALYCSPFSFAAWYFLKSLIIDSNKDFKVGGMELSILFKKSVSLG